MKLDLFKTARSDGDRVISIQPRMTEVANGTPVEDSCWSEMDACYETFDKDGDGKLNLEEFRLVCKAIFRNDKGHIYPLSEERAKHIFQVFDKNDDGFIDKEEFAFCWNHWIKVIVRPVSAFLVVDVQNDFISATLNISKCNAQQDGSEVSTQIKLQL
ncbi:Troponin C, skeletal muscle [Eumeta japonica]|uniref:Troponin C, skeletal muscle n=1 Tax=Eumeta variegata TaxID=151549 RepID=A0A4C1Z0K6_EUMVA|nr:Troponin C, skeletal muscle [Eumeta japonica]